MDLAEFTQRSTTTGTVRLVRRREEVDAPALLAATQNILDEKSRSIENQKTTNSMLEASNSELKRKLEEESSKRKKEKEKRRKQRTDLQAKIERRDKQLAEANSQHAEEKKTLEVELWWWKVEAQSQLSVAEEKATLQQHLSRQILSQLPDCSTLRWDYAKRRLEIDDPKFAVLRDYFLQSMVSHRRSKKSSQWCPGPDVEVTYVEEVVNPARQRAYETTRSNDILRRNHHGCSAIPGITAFKCTVEDDCRDLNEYLLFHGCPQHRVDDIAWHGIDPQRGGEAVGSMFGRGAYFAQNASKSDLYTTCSDCHGSATFKDCYHLEGERCIVIVRVMLGETKLATTHEFSHTIRAPERPNGEPFESITAAPKDSGGIVDHHEFIIFDKQLALVRYLVYYRHKPSCQCRSCLHRRK